jgi:hypothetical protein
MPYVVQIPLSFAAMIGGMCTLMGSSINLVAAGLLEAYDPKEVPPRVQTGHTHPTLPLLAPPDRRCFRVIPPASVRCTRTSVPAI